MDDSAPHHAPPSARGLLAAGIEALRTRVDLAAVELEIHLLLLARTLAWIVGAIACVLLALAFGLEFDLGAEAGGQHHDAHDALGVDPATVA